MLGDRGVGAQEIDTLRQRDNVDLRADPREHRPVATQASEGDRDAVRDEMLGEQDQDAIDAEARKEALVGNQDTRRIEMVGRRHAGA